MTDLAAGRLHAKHPKGQSYLVWFEPELYEGNPMTIVHADRAYPAQGNTLAENIQFWSTYLSHRTGTYEFRCRRFDAVIDHLNEMGMRPSDSIMDVGAGRMEFARRLRESGHTGQYVPIDGSIDGCDLNEWQPPDMADWIVCIETIEHVHDPERLVRVMKNWSLYGTVLTTPNPAVVDVMAMDATHLTPVNLTTLHAWDFNAKAVPLFTTDADTIVAWRGSRD